MMTAHAATQALSQLKRLGATDYLPKPFTPDELRGMVGRVLAPTSKN
jgi:CheY-like chemotaxis protein